MGITAVVCLLLCLMSFWRGERAFPWYEWAFLLAAAVIFIFYLLSHQPTTAAVLAAIVSVLGFGPTVTKAWHRPHSDSITTFTLNSIKFVPAFFAMDNLTLATCVMPAALVVANAAVALIIYARRAHQPNTVILRCERSEPRRMPGRGAVSKSRKQRVI